MLTPKLLLVHREVVESGTLAAAAAALRFTVSGVSQQLSALEKEAGVPLYEKAGRRLRPTPAGLLLAERADRILAEIRDAESALADLSEGRTARLRVVSFHSAGEALLPSAIARLRRSMPELRVHPVVEDTEGALRRLRGGDAEVVVAVDPYPQDAPPEDDLHRFHLLDDEYRILLPEKHPLAKRRRIDLLDLADTNWIITAAVDDYLPEVTHDVCRRAGFSPRVAAEGDQFSLTQGYVAVGLGVALVPLLSLGAVRRHVVVRRLKQPPEPRHIWVLTRPALLPDPAVNAMLGALVTAAVTGSTSR